MFKSYVVFEKSPKNFLVLENFYVQSLAVWRELHTMSNEYGDFSY